MAIHLGKKLGVAAERTVDTLTLPQVFEPAGDFVRVIAAAVGVATAKKGEQRQAGDARVGIRASAAAVLIQYHSGRAGSVA